MLGVLSVWRVTHLLHAEDGPWDLVVRLRVRLERWGKLLDCFYCLSLWLALPIGVIIGSRWSERMLLWLALSGGAILLERATTSREQVVPAAQYLEDKEETDVVLRSEKATVQQKSPGSSDS